MHYKPIQKISLIYHGKPRGLVLSVILQEHSGGNIEVSRAAMSQAVDKGGAALAVAAVDACGRQHDNGAP